MLLNTQSAEAATPYISLAGTWPMFGAKALNPASSFAQLASSRGQSSGQLPMAQVLDALSLGMWLLATDGSVLFANRCAKRMGRAFDGTAPSVVGGKLHLANSAAHSKLLAAIKGAAQGKWGMVGLSQPSGNRPLTIVPLDEGGTGQEAVALAVLAGAAQGNDLAFSLFCREHGISPAERHVLAELCAGQEPEEVAKTCGVALTTVRTQIGSIRTKTRSKSLKHLLCTVAALPPVASRAMN